MAEGVWAGEPGEKVLERVQPPRLLCTAPTLGPFFPHQGAAVFHLGGRELSFLYTQADPKT